MLKFAEKYLYSCVFCLLPFALFGQEDTLQTLEKQAHAATGREQAQLFNQLSEKYQNAEPKKARQYAYKAAEIAKRTGFALGEALAYKNIGIVYNLQGNNSQALEYFLKALQIYEKVKDETGVSHTLHDIGAVYQNLKQYEEAQKYYNKALAIDQKKNNKKGEAGIFNNMGDIYYQKEQATKALEYYQKSLAIRQEIQDNIGIANTLKNIGLVKHTQNDYKTALLYYFQSLKIDERLNNQANQAATLGNIAETYLKLEYSDSAQIYAIKSFSIAEKKALKREMIDAGGLLADIYTLKKNFEKAYEYKNLQLMLKEEVFEDENTRKIGALQNSYELEKSQIQNSLLSKNNQFQWLLIISGIGGTGLLFLLILLLYRSIQRKNKGNKLLQEQNEAITLQMAEINQQKEEITAQRDAIEDQLETIEVQKNQITEKNTHIESSIRYALRIQQAMLPYEQRIDEVLPYNFIFYRPRDVVSGDFYWFGKIDAKPIYEERETFDGIQRTLKGFQNELAIIAAIDCTGHGVPGAFMSMIGDALLNQIIVDKGNTNAGQILTALHKGIRKALKQGETQNRDGMDMALCVIDQEEKTVAYAGAKNSLIYIQNNEVKELKANIFSVGGWQEVEEEERKYSSETLNFAETPLQIYLYSDGFQDQFGGEEGKKFMRKRFKQLLFDVHEEPMAFQKNILEKTFLDWMGEQFQVDDVLVMGIKLG